MSTDEINSAIAEHLGWEDCLNGFGTETRYKGTPSEVRVTVPFPRYSEDLNAMHEAEKKIVDWVFWRIQLSHVVGIGYAPDLDICEDIKSFASATAAQRAEAFLRTVGKWRDS